MFEMFITTCNLAQIQCKIEFIVGIFSCMNSATNTLNDNVERLTITRKKRYLVKLYRSQKCTTYFVRVKVKAL